MTNNTDSIPVSDALRLVQIAIEECNKATPGAVYWARTFIARIDADRAKLAEVQALADKYEQESEQKGADLMAAEAQLAELRAQIDGLSDPCHDCGHARTLDDDGEMTCEVCRLRAQVEQYEGLIAAVSCNEATVKDCVRYCAHGEDALHAEGRAIRARKGESRADFTQRT